MTSQKVYFYTTIIPNNSGSGAKARIFTNIRAYHDLNYNVEVLIFTKDNQVKIPRQLKQTNIDYQIIKLYNPSLDKDKKIWVEKINPIHWILNELFPIRKFVKSKLTERIKGNSNSIHHFEYLDIASACYGLNGNFIWSNHDIVSERFKIIQNIRQEIGRGKNWMTKYGKYFLIKFAERLIIKTCNLTVTISNYDFHWYSNYSHKDNIKLLPCSWPEEKLIIRKRDWLEDGRFRLLHLGSTNSILTFSSLQYIILELFTKMPNALMERIELNVVGNHPNAPYSNRIRKISNKYPQIKFLGFQEDLTPYFSNHDIQIVGTQVATGIRTKIIESFARGLPVLSSFTGAQGLHGIEHGKNILLADSSKVFLNNINNLIKGKYELSEISKNAKDLYNEKYARHIHAERLKEYLETYCN